MYHGTVVAIMFSKTTVVNSCLSEISLKKIVAPTASHAFVIALFSAVSNSSCFNSMYVLVRRIRAALVISLNKKRQYILPELLLLNCSVLDVH